MDVEQGLCVDRKSTTSSCLPAPCCPPRCALKAPRPPLADDQHCWLKHDCSNRKSDSHCDSGSVDTPLAAPREFKQGSPPRRVDLPPPPRVVEQ